MLVSTVELRLTWGRLSVVAVTPKCDSRITGRAIDLSSKAMPIAQCDLKSVCTLGVYALVDTASQ